MNHLLLRLRECIPERFWDRSNSAPSLAEAFPAGVSFFYFEVHFEAAAHGQLRDLLGLVSLRTRPPVVNTSTAPVTQLTCELREWFERSECALGCQPNAWLELDNVVNPDWAQRPLGFSLCVDPTFQRFAPPKLGAAGLPPTVLRQLVDELDEHWNAPSGCGGAIERVAERWPRAGRIRHLSIMRGRPDQPRKLYGMLPRQELGGFLADIEWPGPSSRAVELAAELQEPDSSVHVDLTLVKGRLIPRIALEYFSEPPPYRDFKRTRLLDRARALGLIDDLGIQGLHDWLGEFREHLDDAAEPSRVVCWFDLKFVLDEQRLSLKAYLGANVLR